MKAGPDKTGECPNLHTHSSRAAAQRRPAAAEPADLWTAAALRNVQKLAGAYQQPARYGAKLQTLSLLLVWQQALSVPQVITSLVIQVLLQLRLASVLEMRVRRGAGIWMGKGGMWQGILR